VDASDLQGLRRRERRKEAREPFCEHRLACTWRTDKKQVMTAGSSDLDGEAP
jgi:hypothetical protein